MIQQTNQQSYIMLTCCALRVDAAVDEVRMGVRTLIFLMICCILLACLNLAYYYLLLGRGRVGRLLTAVGQPQ
jgi:hypothetical protein